MPDIEEKKLESITDDLFYSFQLFFRKLAKEEARPSARRFDPSRFVLMTVMKNGPTPMSEIGNRMDISRPYMTALVDKLIIEGLVERIPDKDDRRIVNVAITKAGRESIRAFKDEAREAVKKNLFALSPEDIASLHESMETIRKVISKLDRERTM